MKKRTLKKGTSLLFAAIYLQVNVAWSASPTLPLPSILFAARFWKLLGLRKLSLQQMEKEKVLVFHDSLMDELQRMQQRILQDQQQSKTTFPDSTGGNP